MSNGETTTVMSTARTEKSTTQVEAPHLLFKGVTRLIVQSLPEYIPAELKEALIASHPDPDIKFQKVKKAEGRNMVIPEYITPKDRFAYQVGLHFLNEVVTQALTIEMLDKKINIAKAVQKLPSLADEYIKMFTEDGAFPLNDKNVGLLQQLQIAYLSGKRNDLDNYLNGNYGFTVLEDLAVVLGRAIIKSSKNVENDTNSITTKDELVGGMMSREYPGRVFVDTTLVKSKALLAIQTVAALSLTGIVAVENTQFHSPENHAILSGLTVLSSLVTAFNGYFSVRYAKVVVNSTIGIAFHELVHYLSTDFANKRTGFIHYK